MRRTACFLLSVWILSNCVTQSFAYYHPDEGRWVSRDPLGEEAFFQRYKAGKPFSVKLGLLSEARQPGYLFLQNGSINKADVFGLAAVGSVEDNVKCLCCMLYGESRGQPSACQEAVAWVIRNRAAKKGGENYCSVVSSGFDAYSGANYKDCYKGCVKAKDKSDYDATIETCTSVQEKFESGEDSTGGATIFVNHGTSIHPPAFPHPEKLEPVSVPGCSVFDFYIEH